MKNTTKGVLAGIAIALGVSACASSTAATPAHNYLDIHDGGGNFLPAYMDYLQGKSAMPKDTCEAHTVEQLFSDEPGPVSYGPFIKTVDGKYVLIPPGADPVEMLKRFPGGQIVQTAALFPQLLGGCDEGGVS